MTKIFKQRFTKWIPLGSYSQGGDQYIAFVRKNLKTEMMHSENRHELDEAYDKTLSFMLYYQPNDYLPYVGKLSKYYSQRKAQML